MMKRTTRAPHVTWLALMVTIAGVLFAGCGATASAGAKRSAATFTAAPPTPTATPIRPPLIMREVYDGWRFTTPKDMCQGTPLVAEVIVGGTGPGRWTTPDGARPATSDYRAIEKAGWHIVTPVRFSRFNILLDHRTSQTQEFLMLGGQVGQDSEEAIPFPQLAIGARYVVVFSPDNDLATGKYTEVRLLVFNAFPIDQQNIVTLQVAGDPNEPGVGPVQQQIMIPLSQLQQDLAHCG